MRIFVTGGTGFIGVHLVRKLIRQHHEVTVLVRTPSRLKFLPPSVEVMQGDLTLFRDENLVLPEFDYVIHLAGTISADSARQYYDDNCEATIELVRCLVRQDWRPKRFLYASSLAAAGPSGDDDILTEDEEPAPVEPYGKAKRMAEEFLHTVSAFPTTSFRPAIVFGPGDPNTLVLFRMAKFRVGFSVDGKPQMLSFVDVDDLNEAIIRMMGEETKEHQIYFVAHPDIISNEDIFLTLGEIMHHRVVILPLPKAGLKLAVRLAGMAKERVPAAGLLDEKQYLQMTHHFMCSGHRLEQRLGWEARKNLKSSLNKALYGYRALNML